MSEIVSSPSVVNEREKRNLHHSTFPLKQLRFTTEQFGLVKPHIAFDGVSDDNLRFRSSIGTHSYTLSAPLYQDVHRRTSYIKVDYPAILPLNFEKFFSNPVNGEDVPDLVNCSISDFYKFLASRASSAISTAFLELIKVIEGSQTSETYSSAITRVLKVLVLFENFYSRGSLLSALGCRISKQLTFATPDKVVPWNRFGRWSYDELFDYFCGCFVDELSLSSSSYPSFRCVIDGKYYQVSVAKSNPPTDHISFLAFLDLIRDTGDWRIDTLPDGFEIDINHLTAYDLFYKAGDNWHLGVFSNTPSTDVFNFSRVCAYQLALAEFFTNDHVDNIYSAELYRQYIGSLLYSVVGNQSSFTLNGVRYYYDYLSGYNLKWMLQRPFTLALLDNAAWNQYFLSLFGYRRSLRYKDYFVSSRIQPLAVGDVNVNVVSNQVNVVDISRNIQRQRFLNRVNHIGRSLENYIRGVFGVDVKPDRHVPHFLVDFDELVYTAEVENTGEAQQTENNSITATFTGNTGNKEVEVFVDVPCIIIGLQSYDIERTYIDNIDRQFFVKDRFDMFVPELQFVGDQPIYPQELRSYDSRRLDSPFGYQYRDMQYKMLVPSSDGGFVQFLPSYNFMFLDEAYSGNTINSGFIRALPAELDKFYLSMTGYSMASRFHFISRIVNNVVASRPMIANPNILE